MVIVYVIAAAIVGAEIRIRGKVRKRSSAQRRHRAILPPCPFNETIIENEWSLMEAIGKSKYIFTGKILNVKKYRAMQDSRKRSNLYKVHLRRVLKGDMSELRTFVKSEGSPETLSGSVLSAERPRARDSCAPGPRPRLSGIFFSNVGYNPAIRGPMTHLQLLTDPVPLTLYHLDRINAAVKGKSFITFVATQALNRHNLMFYTFTIKTTT